MSEGFSMQLKLTDLKLKLLASVSKVQTPGVSVLFSILLVKTSDGQDYASNDFRIPHNPSQQQLH